MDVFLVSSNLLVNASFEVAEIVSSVYGEEAFLGLIVDRMVRLLLDDLDGPCPFVDVRLRQSTFVVVEEFGLEQLLLVGDLILLQRFQCLVHPFLLAATLLMKLILKLLVVK